MTSVNWNEAPPVDEDSRRRSEQIDEMLKSQVLSNLNRRARTLILSESSADASRETVHKHLAQHHQQLELASFALSKHDKSSRRKLATFEPSIFVYVVDPFVGLDLRSDGGKSSQEPSLVHTRMQKSLSHFHYACRILGIETWCVVVVLINTHDGALSRLARGWNEEERSLFPALPLISSSGGGETRSAKDGDGNNNNIMRAIQIEFEVAARSSSRPREVIFGVETAGFSLSASLVSEVVTRAHERLLSAVHGAQMTSDVLVGGVGGKENSIEPRTFVSSPPGTRGTLEGVGDDVDEGKKATIVGRSDGFGQQRILLACVLVAGIVSIGALVWNSRRVAVLR